MPLTTRSAIRRSHRRRIHINHTLLLWQSGVIPVCPCHARRKAKRPVAAAIDRPIHRSRVRCSTASTAVRMGTMGVLPMQMVGSEMSGARWSLDRTIGPASTIQGLEPDSLRHAAAAHRLPSLHTDSPLQPTSGSARASHAPEKKFPLRRLEAVGVQPLLSVWHCWIWLQTWTR